ITSLFIILLLSTWITTFFPYTTLFRSLSYTTFNYSGLDISSDTIRKGESVEVSVTVKNEGDVMGKEIVQLYIHDLFSSITRPVKELRRFEKIALSPGEEQQVTFTLNRDDFSFYNSEMEKVVEAGEFNIMVGSSSADTDLQKV